MKNKIIISIFIIILILVILVCLYIKFKSEKKIYYVNGNEVYDYDPKNGADSRKVYLVDGPKSKLNRLFPPGAITLPPLGIFINKNVTRHLGNVIIHESTHWKQQDKAGGALPFYVDYVKDHIKYGYDKNPYEVEARINSYECSKDKDNCTYPKT